MPLRCTAGRNTHRAGCDQQGRGRRQRNWPQQQQQVSARFKGNCADLQGHIFDCSNYKQADNFVNTLKRISEYAGAAYKQGGDIHSSIINELGIIIQGRWFDSGVLHLIYFTSRYVCRTYFT
jgi:hypothetical protein